MKVTTRNLTSDSSVWPILITELPSSKEESIRILHSLSDWVITIDRNAGMEYFDSPKRNQQFTMRILLIVFLNEKTLVSFRW